MQKDKMSAKKKQASKDTTEKVKNEKKSSDVKDSDLKKVKTVKSQKLDKEKSKPATKYHFSVNLTSNKPSNVSQKVSTESKSSSQVKTDKPKSQSAKTNFTKEAEAVRVAETTKSQEVKHIKYSEQNKGNKVALGSILDGADSADTKESSKLDQIKNSIDQIKSDPKSFKELQNFVKPSLLVKTKQALVKRVSLKYWTLTLMSIMKAIDLFISFIIMPRGEGRNQALQKARSPVLFGLWVFFIFFIIGGFWAGFAPLDKAVPAQGFIVTSSKKQVIQHKEGGVVEAIYAKEGDHVKIDQSLVRLESIQVKTQLESLYEKRKETAKLVKTKEEQVIALRGLVEEGIIAKYSEKIIPHETQLTQLKSSLSEITAQIKIAEESLGKLVIKSPVNGVVTQVNVTTIGGTISPGQAIMTITPSQEDLILEAYVQAKDIEPVYVGLKAKVQISAFVSKTTSPLEGIVTYISPNIINFIQQPGGVMTQESAMLQQARGVFYKVRISIDKRQLKKISKFKDYELTPGMDANIQITIGERTLIQYLLDPILMTFWHAFKEK
ncbi:MAG: HlyD family efflux transporter periplasmic adaptor subunit [Rickettsiales bacterium]|nr:HlyD family efflux transporter periplasmic adaptor subunit [Rickettsiales bacterium]